MSRTSSGFTLIEILIALSVFAILATITSAALYDSFRTREILTAQADQLNELQLAISLIKNDTEQVIERPVVSGNMHMLAAFIGTRDYVSFTRDGVSNPLSIEKRSSLKRIALLCKEGQLIRRSWPVLDPPNINQYEDKRLMHGLTDCYFEYINRNLDSLSEWREKAVSQNQKPEPFPKAIQLHFAMKGFGDSSLLFVIPEALY